MSAEFLRSEREPVLDHCGIVAACALRADIKLFQPGLEALKALQTRGQDGAGFGAITFAGATFWHKGEGMLGDVFPSSVQQDFSARAARMWVFQVRYGTNGNFSAKNVQPLLGSHAHSRDPFIVAHNGQFSGEVHEVDDGTSDTYRFTQELAESPGSTWETRIISVLEKKRGAWSLAIATPEGMFLARDPYGFRPLVYGWLWHGESRQRVAVAASETRALEQMGIRDFTEVMPGQLLHITENVVAVPYRCNRAQPASCIFETVYIHDEESRAHIARGDPFKINESPTTYELRQRCGKILAFEAPLTAKDVDFVVGIPGTGIAGGRAFAGALRLPYKQVITDRVPQQNPRTFLTADIASIHELAVGHFAFDAGDIAGQRIVIVDDSIVRGNIQRAVIALLRKYGALAVHSRSLSPPIDKGCHLGINTRTHEELIAHRYGGNVEKIRQAIGADSLAYLSSRGLREALTGNPENCQFCMGCMVGHKPPIDRFGNVIYERK